MPDTRRFGSRGEAQDQTAATVKQAAAPRSNTGSSPPVSPAASPSVVSPVQARPRTGTPPAPVAANPPLPPAAVVERHRTQEAPPLPKRVLDVPDVTAIEGSEAFSGRLPDWGTVGDARKTVMMTASSRESPIAQALEPPKIEVVQHEMPDDGPLDRRLVLVRDSDSTRAAAFRVLRHHILERGQPKVVAVSSANDREGKTTCAVNLALAMAECGRGRVLLIDGNLRRPELAGVFRFVPPWCFAEQLQVHREQPLLPWGVVEVRSMWLHVAAVNPRRDPSKVRDAPSFGIALERLRLAPYDHIVIDCPAVLGSADVNLIQDAADGVLLVARKKTSTVRDLRRAVEQLTPAKVLGTALLE
ncbi:MAG TPA: CpsD/CapB family tyrosine-protein kinase [Kofleriaceae bacterium]|nr:CpsD/CapB family tyrosine-protein kinase [Kofleriaceae bacterium]